MFSQGRHRRAAQDHGRADGRRQEADRAQSRRHDQGGRVRAAQPVGGARARRSRNAWGAKWFDVQRKPQLADDPGWAAAFTWQKQLIDWYGYDNITKFFAANTNNEFNHEQRVRERQGGDDVRRRVAHRVHQARQHPNAQLRHRAVPGRCRPSRPCTARPRRRHHRRHPQGRASTPTRRGCWSSTWPPTPTTWCRWRTRSATCRPRKASSASPDLTLPPQFETFLHVWANPKSAFAPPLTPSGGGYADLLDNFDRRMAVRQDQ